MLTKTILFDIFPAQSHFLSSFKLASLLKDEGHRVVYLTHLKYRSLIVEAGYEFESIDKIYNFKKKIKVGFLILKYFQYYLVMITLNTENHL